MPTKQAALAGLKEEYSKDRALKKDLSQRNEEILPALSCQLYDCSSNLLIKRSC